MAFTLIRRCLAMRLISYCQRLCNFEGEDTLSLLSIDAKEILNKANTFLYIKTGILFPVFSINRRKIIIRIYFLKWNKVKQNEHNDWYKQ